MKKTKTQESHPLLIDCQVFQSFAWQRGMGKYSLEFLKNTLVQPEIKKRKVYFIFNINAKPNNTVREQLKKIAPNATLLDIHLELPKAPREERSVQATRLKNKVILSKAIDENFEKSTKLDFLILALYLDEVCPVFPDNENISSKILIYYDSIPYLYHQRYGQFKGFFSNFYLPHTATVFESTNVLTISQTVANDLHLYFGIPKEIITNINGASISRKNEISSKPKNWDHLKDTFILMPSGQELRKNNQRAVQGFHDFISQANKDYFLVATSYFTDTAKEELRKISDRIIFTDNVNEGELEWLYKNCRFVLFASEYEGLGLPVLEAVELQKRIACSDISVFREISTDAFYFFDPLDIKSIVNTLHIIDADIGAKDIKLKEYDKVRLKYTWANTAKEFLYSLNQKPSIPDLNRPKVAIFCPDPSGFSAIGKVVAESHAWYSKYFDIDYYFDTGPNHIYTRPNYLQNLVNCFKAENFTSDNYKKYDAVIYHIGNSEYHLNTIRTALVLPGYVILHDTNLGGAYSNLLELGYISNKRYQAEIQFDKTLNSAKNGKDSSFLGSIINNQYGAVVHSRYSKNAVLAKNISNTPVIKLELPVSSIKYDKYYEYDISKKITIGFAGIIAKVKGIEIIEEIAMADEFANCQINIFGFSMIEPEQLKRIRYLPHTFLKTNPTDFEFQQLMSTTDILVNVRLENKGETSLTTLENMRYGGVAIVRDFGWYSELPNECVVKVDKPEDTIQSIRDVMSEKVDIKLLGKESMKYIQKQHSHKNYAEGMYNLINKKVERTI